MKKSSARTNTKRVKVATLVVGVAVVMGGSFMVASGQITGLPGALLASVFSAFSGRPSIVISRNAASPSGVVTTGGTRTIAIFDIGSKNTTYWVNLQTLSIDISLAGSGARTLGLSKFTVTYNYCIPSGVTYGYGYRGGQCATISIPVNSANRVGNTYRLIVYPYTPIYPQASGQITVSAYPSYGIGGASNDTSQLRATITSGAASGDQCRAYTYGFYTGKYGYSQCVPLQANVYGATANTLTVQRSYGYGYCLL